MRLTSFLLVSLCGVSAHAQVFNWNNAAGGTWHTSGNWDLPGFPNVAGTSAVISLPGSYVVQLSLNTRPDTLQLLNPNVVLSMSAGANIELQTPGNLINNGEIVVNDIAFDGVTSLWFKHDSTISGTGSIRFNAYGLNLQSAQILIDAGKKVTLESPQRIRGRGQLVGAGELLNNSKIVSDKDVFVIACRVTGSPTSELNTPAIGPSITYNAGAVIVGGRLTGDGHWFSGGKISGATIVDECTAANMHVLSGGIINNDTIHINESGNQFGSITIDESATISGTGMIRLGGTANTGAVISGNNSSVVLTNAPPHVIRGSGSISVKMINKSVIRASNSGRLLTLASAITQQDAGSIQAGSGDIALGTGAIIAGGIVQKAPGTTTGRVRVTGDAKVDGVTSTVETAIDGGGFLRLLEGGLTNNALITVNTTGNATAAQLGADRNSTIGGTGTILLNAGANLDSAQLRAFFAPVTLTLGQGQTVRGSGRFYGSISSGALLSPGATDGAIGRFEPRGAIVLAAESRIRIDATGNGAGQFDAISSNAPITVDGAASFVLSGWNPVASCASLDFLVGSAVSGAFDSYTVNASAPAGKVWRLHYTPTGVSLRLTCPADLDGDCGVDDADFSSFAGQYNILLCSDPVMPQYCPGDLNGDGFVDDADFVLFVAAYDQLICP